MTVSLVGKSSRIAQPGDSGKKGFLHSPAAKLVAVSLIGLFCELMIVRWLATEVRIFAYYKNIPLLAAFIGFSMGFLFCRSKVDLWKNTSQILMGISGLLMVAFPLGLTHLSFLASSQVVMFGNFSPPSWLSIAGAAAVALGIFCANVALFVGLGQETGRLMEKLNPIKSYTLNIFGGLLGIGLFSLLSYLQCGPGVWLVLSGIMLFSLQRTVASGALVLLGFLYSLVLAPAVVNQVPGFETTVWSPYYRVDVRKTMVKDRHGKPMQWGSNVYINYDSFQSMTDCRPQTLAQLPKPFADALEESHAKPFLLCTKKQPDVLILGAGTGSDVAAALRHGAGHVDAVEIDPGIYEIGKKMHPERPYDSPKVSVFIEDARTFLKHSQKKYDLVVFAMLDSHTAYSSVSSLRTDNYIFTEESMKEVSRLLSKNGLIYVTFINSPNWLWDRHVKALTLATGKNPRGWYQNGGLPVGVLAAGPGLDNVPGDFSFRFTKPKAVEPGNNVTGTCTDDWPFLYLPNREVSGSYIMPIILLLSIFGVPFAKQYARSAQGLSPWIMFALGMGFMLLEVRSMAAISLLIGSTWICNSIIIAAVMVAIIAANAVVSRMKSNSVVVPACGLLLSLLISLCVEPRMLLNLGTIAGIICGCAAFITPMVFASSIFSIILKRSHATANAFSFNMAGGVIGICLEYSSMVVGIHALGYIALAIYCFVITALIVEVGVRPGRFRVQPNLTLQS